MNQPSIIIIDETTLLSLGELCRICRVHADWVIELIDEGIVEPVGGTSDERYFDLTALNRVQNARRLARDLGVNMAGIGLALELLDELKPLRRWYRNRVF